MFLICFALVAIRIWWSLEWSVTEMLTTLKPLHHFCLSRIEHHALPDFYLGLICGYALPRENSTVQLFLNTGLYHLLVVSGSHLIFIAAFLSRLRLKRRLWHWFCLIGYACMCLLSPPISRSLLQIGLGSFNAEKHLFWTQEQLVFYSGIVCLLLFPDWFFSFSFVLSWTASLTLCFTRRIFFQHCLIFCFMWPLLKNISPISIVYNFLLSPIFSLILFPISVVTFVLPVLNTFTQPLWILFLAALEQAPQLPTTNQVEIPSLSFLWIYIGTLHVMLQILPLWRETPETRLREFTNPL